MTSKKVRNLLIGLIALGLAVFIIISFIGISTLNKKSRTMVEQKVKSANVDAQLINLSRAKQDVEKYKTFNDIAKTVIPNDKNQVQAIADIFQIAEEVGILLQSVSFPNSTLGAKPSSVPAASASGQATAAAPATSSAISQAKPFPGVPGLYSLELTITPQGGETIPANKQVTYQKFIAFLNAIENNRRTAQITQVTIHPVNTNNSTAEFINFTLMLNIFIKP